MRFTFAMACHVVVGCGLLMLMGQDVQAFSDFLFYVLGTHVSWQQFSF